MKKRKYPKSLFIYGFITNVLFYHFYLSIPSFILLIVGIFNKNSLIAGLALLVIDLIISLIDQIRIRNTFLRDSDNPSFQEFQDIFSKDGDWRENLREQIEEKRRRYDEEDV